MGGNDDDDHAQNTATSTGSADRVSSNPAVDTVATATIHASSGTAQHATDGKQASTLSNVRSSGVIVTVDEQQEVGRTELHKGNDEKSSEKEMSDDERIAMLRKRNAVYSKRKYYKKKKEVSSLETQKFVLETQNQALKKENLRLESLLIQARQQVAALHSYPNADLVGGTMPSQFSSFLGLRPFLYQPGSFPHPTMFGSAFGGMSPLGGVPFGTGISNPYMVPDAYLRHSALDQERAFGRGRTSTMFPLEMSYKDHFSPSNSGVSMPPIQEAGQPRTHEELRHMGSSTVPPVRGSRHTQGAGISLDTQDGSARVKNSTKRRRKDSDLSDGKL